jgi:hypothetical protein
MADLVTIRATERSVPPHWALGQRALIAQMNRLARPFVERYTRPDGTLIWRREWPGMDGSDDAYESFVSFPLFYLLGGGDHVLELARREWNALTWQFTRYGQVYREFDAYYDWMHHGESYTYIYYLALADPDYPMERARALSFAALYTGEDPEAPNWDAERRMIRSPITGSRGPRLHMSAEDWVTHRPILAEYLAPYEDVPGFESSDPFVKIDWNDGAAFARILERMNARMVPGDVPLNLNATSLVTTAFLYTGEEKYRQWVLDYLAAWAERTRRNGGIMPDNVGPSGQIGERMNGKWWGGYYGWRWPHGAWIILEATLIAGSNAMLLTGDPSWLDLHRSQADLLWSLRREEDGVTKVPARHGDVGWFDYRPLLPDHYVRLYFMTQREDDRARLEERFPGWRAWRNEPRFFKAGAYPPLAWCAYVEGANPDFPERVLEDTYTGICQRLERIERDTGDPETWDVHHWQDLNPVLPEGLAQMALGTPGAVYHGGLLHTSVRYFDPQRRRAGLPEAVAALVERVEPGAITLTLVNTDLLEAREVIVQAGAFGEHLFTTAQRVQAAASAEHSLRVESPWLRVRLGPAALARLRLGLRRFARTPSAALPPWGDEGG